MIILLGAPGAGKSTQGQMLVDRGKVRWISMGEILRQNIKGEQLQRMKLGKLLDSNEVIEMLSKALHELGDEPELILDGFPRAIDHAKWLINQIKQDKIRISALINLFAKESVVKERLMTRGRLDDNEQVIADRYKIYIDAIRPIAKLLSDAGVPIIEIDASQSPLDTNKDIVDELSMLKISI
jgi:adenylate kinase